MLRKPAPHIDQFGDTLEFLRSMPVRAWAVYGTYAERTWRLWWHSVDPYPDARGRILVTESWALYFETVQKVVQLRKELRDALRNSVQVPHRMRVRREDRISRKGSQVSEVRKASRH